MEVVYIAGAGRSGSTVLAYLFGSISGFTNVGEAVAFFLNRRLYENSFPCGCGVRPPQCEFWGDVLDTVDPRDRDRGTDLLRNRYMFLLSRALLHTRQVREDLDRLQNAAARVLSVARAKTGARVMIEASKSPSIGLLLARAPGVRLHIVHLVRHPGGVVSSWSRPKEYLRPLPPIAALRNWILSNLATERLADVAASYQRIRYEDFVSNPRDTLRGLTRGIGHGGVDLDFVKDRAARVTVQHALAGNPGKLAEGEIRFSPSSWSLPPLTELTVKTITLPLLRRYGYARGSGVIDHVG